MFKMNEDSKNFSHKVSFFKLGPVFVTFTPITIDTEEKCPDDTPRSLSRTLTSNV